MAKRVDTQARIHGGAEIRAMHARRPPLLEMDPGPPSLFIFPQFLVLPSETAASDVKARRTAGGLVRPQLAAGRPVSRAQCVHFGSRGPWKNNVRATPRLDVV